MRGPAAPQLAEGAVRFGSAVLVGLKTPGIPGSQDIFSPPHGPHPMKQAQLKKVTILLWSSELHFNLSQNQRIAGASLQGGRRVNPAAVTTAAAAAAVARRQASDWVVAAAPSASVHPTTSCSNTLLIRAHPSVAPVAPIFSVIKQYIVA